MSRSPALKFATKLFRDDRTLGVALLFDLVVRSIAPLVLVGAVAIGVGRLAAAESIGVLTTWGMIAAMALVVVTEPLSSTFWAWGRERLTSATTGKLIAGASGSQRIDVMHGPEFRSDYATVTANGTGLGLGDAPRLLILVWSRKLGAALASIVLLVVVPIVGAATLVLWPLARRPLLNAINSHVEDLMTNAARFSRPEYFRRVLSTSAASREACLFGLGDFILGSLLRSFRLAMEPVWRSRRKVSRAVAGVAVAVLLTYTLSVVVIAVEVAQGSLGSRAAVIALMALSTTLAGGSVGYEDIELRYALASLAPLSRLGTAGNDRSTPTLTSPAGDGVYFENVSYTYAGSSEASLRAFSGIFDAGKVHSILGRNGSGKTTLLQLAAGLLKPATGNVGFGGPSCSRGAPDSISFLPQEVSVVDTTLGDFLAVDWSIDQDMIWSVLHVVGLEARVRELPDGLNTQLSMTGRSGVATLSRGQIQRLGLARSLCAIRRGATLVLLDEPTAWIDAADEVPLMRRFLRDAGGCTVLIVSHRFSTLLLAEQIWLMPEAPGDAVETGSHETLMRVSASYRTMYNMQSELLRD
jgi:ATP-binding cassette, subfamily B, bacterial